MTDFPSCDRYAAPGAKRITAQVRLEILADLITGRHSETKICLDNEITHLDLELWRASYRLKGVDGLRSSDLTALAQERRRVPA